MNTQSTPVRFGVIGLNHGHIYGQVNSLTRAGAELVSFYAPEPDLVANFQQRFPNATLVRSAAEILKDESLQVVASASIPCDRAPLGIEVMKHGKDFMVDKPGVTSLAQLAEVKRVQKETGRIYSILYGERLENPATVRAGELVQAGAIGKVIHTIGLGPHSIGTSGRPAWFWEADKFGGIITDIASHQMDQFLFFTGSTTAEVVASQVANYRHPEHPSFQDFGDAMVRGNGGSGYVRVDWFTPKGLGTWGDGRVVIMGTDGFMEIRKCCDLAGRPGGNHLFLVDQKETRYIETGNVEAPYGRQFLHDVLHRTETAMTQAHCFLAMELALQAQAQAKRIG
jgi:predicted dehydrogenase